MVEGYCRKCKSKCKMADAKADKMKNDRDCVPGKCSKCKLKYLCGGCRARAFYKFGNYTQEDPLCAFDNETNKIYT